MSNPRPLAPEPSAMDAHSAVARELNPMGYSVWDWLIEKVYAGGMEKFTEQEQKDKIKEKWDEISNAKIRKSMSSWKKRLRLVDCED